MKEIDSGAAAARLLTVAQAAKHLNLAPATIRAWVARRRISYVKLGRSVRILAPEVEQLIANGFVPARDAQLGA